MPVNCNLRPLSSSFSICLGKGREANVVRDFETLAYFIGSFNWPSPCLKMFKSFLSPLFVFSFVAHLNMFQTNSCSGVDHVKKSNQPLIKYAVTIWNTFHSFGG